VRARAARPCSPLARDRQQRHRGTAVGGPLEHGQRIVRPIDADVEAPQAMEHARRAETAAIERFEQSHAGMVSRR
jgi:hypothetical protein